MELFMKDLTLDEVQYLLKDCELEMKALKSKLISLNMERDNISRKMKLVKKEKSILTEIQCSLERDIQDIDINQTQDINQSQDNTHIIHTENPNAFLNFLETGNDELNKSLYLRYTQSIKREE